MSLTLNFKKYLSVMAISIKASSAYKIKLFFYALTGITQFISCYYLWSTLYSGKAMYNGFTGEGILTYFVIIVFTWFGTSLLPCGNVMLFAFSLIVSYGIAFNLFYLVGLISFITTNIWGIFLTFDLVNLFLSGALLPIRFMPEWLVLLIKVLPFRYVVDFPISIWITGKADVYELLIQIIWFVTLSILTKCIYRQAVSKLDIFGG